MEIEIANYHEMKHKRGNGARACSTSSAQFPWSFKVEILLVIEALFDLKS